MKRALPIWLPFMLWAMSLPAAAAAVHTWVDADGVTHFSDAPPPAGAFEASMIELDDELPPPADPEAEYYSIANQWKRLREERETKARLGLERARIRATEAAAAAATDAPPAPATDRTYPVYMRGYPFYGPAYGFHGAYGHPAWEPGPRGMLERGPHRAKRRDAHERRGGWRSRGPSMAVGAPAGRRAVPGDGTGFSFGVRLH